MGKVAGQCTALQNVYYHYQRGGVQKEIPTKLVRGDKLERDICPLRLLDSVPLYLAREGVSERKSILDKIFWILTPQILSNYNLITKWLQIYSLMVEFRKD